MARSPVPRPATSALRQPGICPVNSAFGVPRRSPDRALTAPLLTSPPIRWPGRRVVVPRRRVRCWSSLMREPGGGGWFRARCCCRRVTIFRTGWLAFPPASLPRCATPDWLRPLELRRVFFSGGDPVPARSWGPPQPLSDIVPQAPTTGQLLKKMPEKGPFFDCLVRASPVTDLTCHAAIQTHAQTIDRRCSSMSEFARLVRLIFF